MRRLPALLAALLLAAPAAATEPDAATAIAPAGGRAPDTVLAGTIGRADFQSYREIPFTFPAGADRLLIQMSLDHLEQRTVVDVGLIDPSGMRGASGSNKRIILVGETAATPSYMAGPMPAGQWKLLLAVPNIREGVTANWQAKLWFLKPGEPDLPPPTAQRGPGWYRGDLHLHSAQSDGSCGGDSARNLPKVPCPLFLTLQTAAARGLDFVSVTEHNSVSHHDVLAEAQPWFRDMLLIPGREITTFFGHFNIHGVTQPIDWRIAAPGKGGTTSFNAIADKVHALGGIVVINHPLLPSGEACMGCGWTMPEVDWRKVDAIEIANGGSMAAAGGRLAGPADGTPFWLDWLGSHASAARPVAAIGASDNHDGSDRSEAPGTVGRPATVVYAAALTQPAILAGIRAGRVFIDLSGNRDSLLDFTVSRAGHTATMGEALPAGKGAIRIEAQVTAPKGATLVVLDVANRRATLPLTGGRQTLTIPLDLTPGNHSIRLIVEQSGAPILLSNAVLIPSN